MDVAKRQELEKKLQSSTTEQERIDTLNTLASVLKGQDTDKMLKLAQEAHERSKSIAYQQGIANSLLNLSSYHMTTSDFSQALETATEAHRLYETLLDSQGQMGILYILTEIAYRIGDCSQSLDYAMQSLTIAQELNNQKHQATAHNGIANAYAITGDYEKALISYQRAKAIAEEIGDTYYTAIVLSNMGTCYRYLEQYSTALESTTAAQKIFSQELAWRENSAINLGITGHIYYDMQDYATAMSYHKQKLEIVEELNSDYLRSFTYGDIGKIHLQEGHLDEALQALHTSIEIAKRIGTQKALLSSYELLVQVYKAQENYREALQYHELASATKEELFNRENDQRQKLMMIKYETQQARLEAQYQKQRAEDAEYRAEQDRLYFEELTKLKNEFISSATHDLKNPLTTIRLNTQLLRRKIGSEFEHHLSRIDVQAERMSALISDMLELAKLETGQALEMAFTSLTSLFDTLIHEYQPIADDKEVSIQYSADCDNLSFYFDNSNMQRALSNLLSNAIKYSPKGGKVTIHVGLSDNEVTIEIADKGLGIPNNELPHIFKRFYRANTNQINNIEGTGLGLAIVKAIIEQHSGSITVSSAMGEGSKFHITLPYLQASKAD